MRKLISIRFSNSGPQDIVGRWLRGKCPATKRYNWLHSFQLNELLELAKYRAHVNLMIVGDGTEGEVLFQCQSDRIVSIGVDDDFFTTWV